MFDSLVETVVSSDWSYLIVFAVAALDAVFPLVPSEATVVTAAALAASGRLSLAPVVAAAAGGALVGDNAAYLVGRLSGRTLRRLASSEKARSRLQWAEAQLTARGGTIVVVSRFVPGGRTATMLAAGVVRYRWRRFVAGDVAAAALWAGYSSALGYLGGLTFRRQPLYGVAVALGLALALGLLFEGVRRLRAKRRSSKEGKPGGARPGSAVESR